MFNGIIEHTGAVRTITLQDGGGARIVLDAGKLAYRVKPGDSIAVDGVCLTVVRRKRNELHLDISPETWRRTNLAFRTHGNKLNLELPMSASSAINGHLVQGHVEDRARVRAWVREGKDVRLVLEIPAQLIDFCVPKGSIAVNGVSLTIASLRRKRIEIALIPYTLQMTNLSDLKTGDVVNVETDLIGRYVVTTWKKEYHNVKTKR